MQLSELVSGVAMSVLQAGPPTGADAPPWLILAIVGGFLVVFPLFWCAVVWLLGRAGGWHQLAQRYAVRDRPASGRRISATTAMIGGVSYRNVLTVRLQPEGFFLEVMLLFRVGHPRLFIPWSDVSARSPRKLLWHRLERLSIGRPVITTITLPAGELPTFDEP